MTVLKYIFVGIIILSVVCGLLGGLCVICAGFLNRNEKYFYGENDKDLKGGEQE